MNNYYSLNAAVFAQTQYEVAYYTLASAYELATQCNDETQLAVIADRATQQRDNINTHAPGHILASPSAANRVEGNWYDELVRKATTALSEVSSKKQPE